MKKDPDPKNSTVLTRRKFVTSAAAGSAFLVFRPLSGLAEGSDQQTGGWPAGTEKFKVFMIGHAHIDPVWLWPWPEGASVVYSTFRSALDRMNENPDFKFTATSAQFYQWIADNDPEMLSEIRKRVKEGRWDICGGWWIEPDMNIPGGEAMVRQGLYGQLAFEKLLGKRSTVAANPDSFGHTSTLPQIISKQGMENYIFMRPGIREKSLPGDHFWWEGIDGTKVLNYRIPISYNDTGSVRKRIEDVFNQLKDQPAKSCLVYYGAGDHGGGATKENIRSIEELRKGQGGPAISYGTTENYFRELRASGTSLPTVKDDLQHHAVGCYTAESEIKKGNRQSEAALITAEKITSVGSFAWKAKCPVNELRTAWQRVLFLQFHDSLAGTSVPEHSQHAREGYGFAMDTAHQAAYLALQKLESQVATEDPDSQYLLVFNPHSWSVKSIVEYDFNWNMKNTSTVEDEQGNPLPHQWTAGSTETGSRNRIIIDVTIPPFGYRQVRIKTGDPATVTYPVIAEEKKLENEFLKVSFLYTGAISIIDKRTGKQVFSGDDGGCRALVINDPSDTWSHDIKTFSDVIGAFGNSTFRIIEKGPLRGMIRSVSTYGNSTLTVDWILSAGAKLLEARVTLDWHEHLKMLKFSFPSNIESPVATYETPYGNIVRQTNGDEDPGQRWIDVTGTGAGGKYGVTVFNDAKYGYSVHGNDIRVSVARSAVYAHHNPRVLDMNAEHIWQDQGIQTFRMAIMPHQGTWKENNAVRTAEELLSAPLLIYQGIHKGKLSKSGSMLGTDSGNVIISSVKLAEKSNELILRCVETNGEATESTISFDFISRKWKGSFRPYEIKTLKLNPVSGAIKEVNLLEE